MADDTRTIKVVITSKDDKPKNPNPEKKSEEEKEEGRDQWQRLGSWLAHQAFNTVKSQIEAEANYEISRYFTIYDDVAGERNLAMAKAYINHAVSMGYQVYYGAVTGAGIAGPVGGFAGAVLAGSVAGVGMALEARRALEQQDLRIAQAEAQLGYTRQRAGWSLTAGSIGENK